MSAGKFNSDAFEGKPGWVLLISCFVSFGLWGWADESEWMIYLASVFVVATYCLAWFVDPSRWLFPVVFVPSEEFTDEERQDVITFIRVLFFVGDSVLAWGAITLGIRVWALVSAAMIGGLPR